MAPTATPNSPASQETIEVLILRGYVPKNAEVLTMGRVPTRQISPGHFEYKEVPATLQKLPKGQVAVLPAAEAKELMKRGSAVRPDEATESQLIMAGLKEPPKPIDDEIEDAA